MTKTKSDGVSVADEPGFSKDACIVIMPPQGCTSVRNRIITTTLNALMFASGALFQDLLMLELGMKVDEQPDTMYLYVEVPWADVSDTDGIDMQMSMVHDHFTRQLTEAATK